MSPKSVSAHVSLVAFGKHPGWDDHIPDLGEMTNRLIEVKRELYVEGIGGSIDSGAWDRLEANNRLEGFCHLFLWRTDKDVVVGRMWSSSDGKGRKRYPMIVCAQCTGVSLSWIVNELLPYFEQIKQRCLATTSSSEVVAIIDSARKELQSLVNSIDPASAQRERQPDPLPTLAEHAAMGENQEGLLRVLYQIDREVLSQRSGRSGANVRAKHIRVPACTGSPADAMMLWTRFLLGRLGDQGVPALVFVPLGQSWVDLILGDQVGPQLYGIRVLPSKLPLASEVPYNLDETFVKQAKQAISAASGGANTVPLLPGPGFKSDRANSKGSHGSGPNGRSVTSWIFIALILLVIVLVGLTLLGQSGLVSEGNMLNPVNWIQWCITHLSVKS